jgi:isopenicillin-N epimerase
MTELDIDGIADRFALEKDVVFLNHGSFGACPLPVLARQTELRTALERQPARFFNQELEPMLDAARAELGAFVGADPDDLAFVTNATHAVNTVLRAYAFKPGDELLTTDHEYNACRNALDFVAERAGASVVVARVPFPIDGPQTVLDAVLARVTPRTRLALLDHITSQTALVFPIADLVRELRARGVETLVDGAHAVGQVPLDLRALGAGYYTSNCHKWLCAPKGCAFLHVRRDLQDRVVPLSISHGRNAVRGGRSRFRLLFDWTGTDDPTPHLVIPDAIRFLSAVLPGGVAALQQRNHALAVRGRALVCAALDLAPAAPESMLGSMATIPLPTRPHAGGDGPRSVFERDPLQVALMDRFRVEIPVFPFPRDGGRCVRLSAQAYNRVAHYERLATGLRELVAGA